MRSRSAADFANMTHNLLARIDEKETMPLESLPTIEQNLRNIFQRLEHLEQGVDDTRALTRLDVLESKVDHPGPDPSVRLEYLEKTLVESRNRIRKLEALEQKPEGPAHPNQVADCILMDNGHYALMDDKQKALAWVPPQLIKKMLCEWVMDRP